MTEPKFNDEKMYTYLKGYLTAAGWTDAMNALVFARQAHEGQTRKSGEPYIIHPMTVACHALALGIKNEDIIATALLHDVLEDCDVDARDLPIKSEAARQAIIKLTHEKGTPLEPYYAEIQEDPVASIVKLLDRCDNVSTMAGVFTNEKTADYIHESDTYVMPLYKNAKKYWRFSDYYPALFVIKYHILSVTDSLRAVLEGQN